MGLRTSLPRVATTIIACFILHNYCKNCNDPETHEDPTSNYDNEERTMQDHWEELDCSGGEEVREEIASGLLLLQGEQHSHVCSIGAINSRRFFLEILISTLLKFRSMLVRRTARKFVCTS